MRKGKSNGRARVSGPPKRRPKRLARKRRPNQTEQTIRALGEVAAAAMFLYRKVMPVLKELRAKRRKEKKNGN